MKTLYKPLPAFAEQDITLLLGKDQGMNTEASLAHAIELLRSVKFGSIIYLNTVQTPRSMFQAARSLGLDPSDGGLTEVDNDPYKLLQIVTIPRGELHKQRKWIDYLLSENYVTHVFVNSWQYAGRNSRCREEAIFLLKELTCGLEKDTGTADPVSVIVYGEEQKNKIPAQRTDRIYGKLAGLAKKVESISIHKEIESEHVAADRLEMIETYNAAGPSPEYTGPVSTIKPRYPNLAAEEGFRELDEQLAKMRKEKKSQKKKAKRITNYELEITNQGAGEKVTEVAATSIEELRRTPVPLSRMPIHLNGYMPDRLPAGSPSQNVISDVIQK